MAKIILHALFVTFVVSMVITSGEAKKKNWGEVCVCPLIYSPVCGSDWNTYPSECELDCAAKHNPDLKKVKDGECSMEGKDNIPRDCMCTLEYRPVCGSDGKTYGNICALHCEKATNNPDLKLDREGPCDIEKPILV